MPSYQSLIFGSFNRKEIKCYALKLIGNHGPRYDAIIHTPRELDPIEYAAIEVSRSAESDESLPSKKYLTDSIKLVTGLHSMLRRLHILVDRDVDTIKELQVVGILNAGRWHACLSTINILD